MEVFCPMLLSEQANFEDRSNLTKTPHVLAQEAGIRVDILRLLRVRK